MPIRHWGVLIVVMFLRPAASYLAGLPRSWLVMPGCAMPISVVAKLIVGKTVGWKFG